MNELPADLAHIERQLEGLPRAEPPKALRQRVLSRVRKQLAPARAAGLWLAASLVAACVLWGYLLQSALLFTDSLRARSTDVVTKDGDDVANLAADIRKLLPEMTPEEAWTQAAMFHMRERHMREQGALPARSNGLEMQSRPLQTRLRGTIAMKQFSMLDRVEE